MIINFHFMQYFLLEHDELISCKYFVEISGKYDRILRFLKFCGKISISHDFCSLSKIVFGQNLLIVNRFPKFLQHICGQTKR